MNFTEFRLKFRRFFRKYKRIIFIVLLVWITIFLINKLIGNKKAIPQATTTAKPHTSVIDSTVETPKSLRTIIEEKIDKYVTACNEGKYQIAFNMLSEDCRKYEFDNDVENFMKHVLVKMPTPKEYSIQSYSTVKNGNNKIYIYEVKFTDDLLATGLTNSTYAFTSDKLSFVDMGDDVQMSAGNYIYHSDIKEISENEYLKIDVIDKTVNYSIETYKVKLTNRSNYNVVIADDQEEKEVILVLPNEVRERTDTLDIVLAPQESRDITFVFPKFVDDKDISQSLVFSSIRVMENYSGTDEETVSQETIQSEIDNAIAKFSMEINLSEK